MRRDTGALQDENKVISAAITDDGGIELVTTYKVFSLVMTSRYAKDNADQFHVVSTKDQNGVLYHPGWEIDANRIVCRGHEAVSKDQQGLMA